MATYSSVLAWRIPGTGEPGGLLSMGSQESDITEPLSTAQLRPHSLDPNYAQKLTKGLKEEVENGTVLVSLLSVTALVSF